MTSELQVTKGTYQLKLLARIPIHNPNFLKASASKSWLLRTQHDGLCTRQAALVPVHAVQHAFSHTFSALSLVDPLCVAEVVNCRRCSQ